MNTITLLVLDQFCLIGHFSKRNGTNKSFSFRRQFLRPNLWNQLCTLSERSNALFVLNDKEDDAFSYIIEKLNKEEGSDYLYKNELQQTYITELVHFLNKNVSNIF